MSTNVQQTMEDVISCVQTSLGAIGVDVEMDISYQLAITEPALVTIFIANALLYYKHWLKILETLQSSGTVFRSSFVLLRSTFCIAQRAYYPSEWPTH